MQRELSPYKDYTVSEGLIRIKKGDAKMLKEIKSEKDVVTTEDLFNAIVKAVKDAGKWPDIIECSDVMSFAGIYNYMFEPHFVLFPGCIEGLYLDLYIFGDYRMDKDSSRMLLGSIKTLSTGDEAMRTMAALYGECLIAYDRIIKDNLDAITRRGYDMSFSDTSVSFSGFKNEESAMDRLAKLRAAAPDKYKDPVLRNNLTRERVKLD